MYATAHFPQQNECFTWWNAMSNRNGIINGLADKLLCCVLLCAYRFFHGIYISNRNINTHRFKYDFKWADFQSLHLARIQLCSSHCRVPPPLVPLYFRQIDSISTTNAHFLLITWLVEQWRFYIYSNMTGWNEMAMKYS